MDTYAVWQSALERAVQVFAQSLVALLSVSGVGLVGSSWTNVLSAVGMAALLSVLTSIASERFDESYYQYDFWLRSFRRALQTVLYFAVPAYLLWPYATGWVGKVRCS